MGLYCLGKKAMTDDAHGVWMRGSKFRLAGQGSHPAQLFPGLFHRFGPGVRYESGGTARPLHPSRLYIFPSFTPYTIEHNPDAPISCLWFHLDLFPTLVPKLVEIAPDEALQCLLRAARLEVNGPSPDAAYLTCLAEALSRQWEKQGFLSPRIRPWPRCCATWPRTIPWP